MSTKLFQIHWHSSSSSDLRVIIINLFFEKALISRCNNCLYSCLLFPMHYFNTSITIDDFELGRNDPLMCD